MIKWLQVGSVYEGFIGEINVFSAIYYNARDDDPDTACWRLRHVNLSDIRRPDDEKDEKFSTLDSLKLDAENLLENWLLKAGLWWKKTEDK